MSTSAIPRPQGFRFDAKARHRFRLSLAWIAMLSLIGAIAWRGFSYYRLDLADRAIAPERLLFRPSGFIGLRMGMFGVFLFLCLFLYPIRKRWRWLGTIGKTKQWLDFHALFGITAPLVITLHASFKFRGLAGIAYWIMIAVAVSGFVGRYLYAQVPRSLNTAEMSRSEMHSLSRDLAVQLEQQAILRRDEIEPLLALPIPADIEHMPALRALWLMLCLDLARPFRVSRLRRRYLPAGARVLTLGGLLPSGHPELEGVITAVRRQSWISTKMLFLRRVQQVFHLWHVVHRPFSYSFALLVVAHIVIAISLGYY